jgi:hypothetical protein
MNAIAMFIVFKIYCRYITFRCSWGKSDITGIFQHSVVAEQLKDDCISDHVGGYNYKSIIKLTILI